MSTYTTTAAVQQGENQAIIDIAQQATTPQALALGKYHVVTTPRGVEHIDLTGDRYRTEPARKTGTVTVRDAGSFLAYFTKHADAGSEVYADGLSITAVLDAHHEDSPRWAGHRLTLVPRTTPELKTWMDASGKLFKQAAFAEFIEDNRADIAEPDGATMLELAQSFEATTKAEFKSSTLLATGERRLVYAEETTASAGRKGDLVIPASFTLGIRPFEGGDAFKIGARFRYRITDSELQLGYKLDRPEHVVAEAFADITAAVQEGLGGLAILNGAPAQSR
jgi:uncharacterized protein YfdQ (DUF2303 family)